MLSYFNQAYYHFVIHISWTATSSAQIRTFSEFIPVKAVDPVTLIFTNAALLNLGEFANNPEFPSVEFLPHTVF